LTENRTKGSQHPERSFEELEAWRTIPEDYLNKLQESLSKRVQAVKKNNYGRNKY